MSQLTNFQRVSTMNSAFGNPRGNPNVLQLEKVRNQSRNIVHEFIELQQALGATPESLKALVAAAEQIQYDDSAEAPAIELKKVRDALCDINVFSYGTHHLLGYNADRDMEAVVNGVMTRFVKDERDLEETKARHAAKGVTQTYTEGTFPTMILKSAVDQPDAPKGKFLKSASYSEPVFYVAAPGDTADW